MKQLFFLLLFLCSMSASAIEQVKEKPSETVMEEDTSVNRFKEYSPKDGFKGMVEG